MSRAFNTSLASILLLNSPYNLTKRAFGFDVRTSLDVCSLRLL